MGFIAISLSIFLFSYVGYRSRNKKTSLRERPTGRKNDKSSNIETEIDKANRKETENLKRAIPEIVEKKRGPIKTKKSKFEVFRPQKTGSKSHHPKILSSDISTETKKKSKV